MPKVFIVIPAHNRKSITLQCLKNLKKCIDYDTYHIVVVDDGSVDGTSKAISDEYPEVLVLNGSGNLWWTGAICLGMKYAYEQQAEYIIWMNDDTFPSPDSLSLMVAHCQKIPNAIVASQCYADQDLKCPTYGGQNKGLLSLNLFHTPLGQVYSCDCMSGNLVCFPKSIIDEIGFPPSKYLPHQMADVLYTWIAKKHGYHLSVCGNAIALCEFNQYDEGWATSEISMLDRWKLLLSYQSPLYPPAFWYYCINFYGNLGFVKFLYSYLKFLLFTMLRFLVPPSVLFRIKVVQQKILRSSASNKFRFEQLRKSKA